MEIVLVAAAFALGAVAALAALREADRRAERRAWTLLAARRPDPPRFDPLAVADLPEPARRFFLFAIEPGAPLRVVARIEMGGEIGMGSKEAPGYRPMRATQLLAPDGFVWRLEAGPFGGSDAMTPRTSWTRFRLAGLVPIARAGGGPDHLRSAFGRLVAEGLFWTPAAFLPGPGVRWEGVGPDVARLTVERLGLRQSLEVTLAPDGRPLRVVLPRWSAANPRKEWRLQPFGGDLAEFRSFDGCRLPTAVDGGNMIGTPDYFPFFKARVTSIRFDDLAF